MNKDIRLYIDGQLIEWSSVPDILLTYQRTDYTNPTITKNTYSKTVTIDGTPNNNNIFNHIWNLERVMDDDFILFNPSQKVDFQLFNDAEVVEAGYAKLDSINKDGYKIAYNITLYGGLGSFFYSLAYDIDTDKEKTLSDLNFTNSPNPDDEFDFEINKNTVWNAWDALKRYGHNNGSYKKWDYINFVPAYNGLPDDFDSNKFLMNVHQSSGMSVMYTDNDGIHYGTLPTTVTDGESAYTTYNGYIYGEMRRECNEWEMRDLRSYLQRPALSVRGLFDAIKNPINNGGYNVVLDNEFFSSGNPYYEKAWITLPMIESTSVTEDSYEGWDWTCGSTELDERSRTVYVKINNINPWGIAPNKLCFKCEIHTTFSGATAQTLYTTCICRGAGISVDGLPVGDNEIVNSTAVQFYINKTNGLGRENTDDVASSNRIVLSSKLPDGSFWDGGGSWNDMPPSNHTKQISIGTWERYSGNDYVWTMEDGTTEFDIEIETNKISLIPMVGFIAKSVCRHDLQRCGQAYDAQYYNSRSEMNNHSFSHLYNERPLNLDSEVVYFGLGGMRSFQEIKKKNLLGGVDGTPCDWLLSYCKLFGLFISKDKLSNTIYIQLRKNWYKNEVIDLEDLIDRSQKIDVTPLTFESKWYNFNYEEAEGKYLDKYKDAYSQDFGKQLVNTQYNFDAEEIDLLEDNKFKNGLTCLEKSNYYNIKKDKKDFTIFPCLYNWSTVSYYNEGNTCEVYMALPAGTITTVFNSNTPNEFYDLLPKLQFCDADKGSVDGDGVLCFFNGLKDTGDVDYWITDDVDEMYYVGDNPCWIQTHCEWDTSWTERIAIQTHTLPSFTRYVEHRNIITATWDFGYTKELYVPYYLYDVNRTPTMYENFWKAYIQDLYSVNTRKVDCYVALNSNDVYDFMKKFYWWDNSIWVCTKVQDYDIALEKSTLCSFTKVNSIDAYFDPPTFDDEFFNFHRSDGGGNIPATGTSEELSFTFNLDCSTDWTVVDDGSDFASFDPNSPLSGSFVVGQEIKASYLPNYSQAPRYCLYSAYNSYGDGRLIRVWQNGYQKEKKLTLTPSSLILPKTVDSASTVSVVVDSSANWFCTTGDWVIIDTTFGYSGQTTITVSATTNDTGELRTSQILFNNVDGMTAILTVKQKAGYNVSIEQNEIFPVYSVPASGKNVFYKLINEIECTVQPMGNTGNYAIASGQVSYNTTIAPQNGISFWIHFNPNTSTVTRNAAFYASYVDGGQTYSVMPTVVQLPLVQEASGNTTVQLSDKGQGVTTPLGASGMVWTATTQNSWITLVTATGSSSSTSVEYSVSSNNGSFRTGYIKITYLDEMGYYCEETIVVNQQGTGGGVVINPTAITVSDRGGSYVVSVDSPDDFTVTINEAWVSKEKSRGGTFVLIIAPNNGYARTTTVVVNTNGSNYYVVINQLSAYSSEYTLDYAPQNIEFASSGGTIDITIRSNSDWDIEEGNNLQ